MIPIRRRAYYRAVKRKEKWALDIAKNPEWSLAWHLAMHFRLVDFKAEFARPDSLLFNTKKEDEWNRAYVMVPFLKDEE